jgi:hypothetical protein
MYTWRERWYKTFGRRTCHVLTRSLLKFEYIYIQGAAQLKTPIHITPSRASKSAIRAVEKLGGTVFCKYYNDLALRDCLKGRSDRTEAAPVRQTDIGMKYLGTIHISHSLLSFQFGTRIGIIEDTFHLKLWQECLLRSWTLDGKSCQSSCSRSRHNSGTVRSRLNLAIF